MIERRVWVLDCETTGTDPEKDKVVEVAGVLKQGKQILKTYTSLVNPGIPIPPTASAIHHITDKDVVDAPGIDAALQPILEEEHDFAVAHNAGFDSRFIDLGTVDWICTWKLAMLLWPDAPGHGNQVLRYWLGVPDPTPGLYPHRALYDSEVTSGVFDKVLDKATQEDPYVGMVQVSKNPVKLLKVNFGKHFGMLWSEVPTDYLNFILNKSTGWDENVLYTAKYWKDRK